MSYKHGEIDFQYIQSLEKMQFNPIYLDNTSNSIKPN
jgi:hypothetical protein